MMRYGPRAWILCLVFPFTCSLLTAADPASSKKITNTEGITEYRLENGVRILLFPDPSTSKVTVNMTVFVGSRHEGYGETGMAHLLEHMVFKGTPMHPDVPKSLRDRGAQFNGTTWVDRTNYFETLNASDANLEFAVRLEADRLVNSYVKREDLLSEMTVVRNEFERGENDPERILSQRMMAAAYEWHNYGKSTIGNRSDIERVPIERLQGFYKKFYQPDNVMVVVAGNFKEAKALEYIVKYFGALKKPTRQLETTYTEEPAQDGERNVVLRRVGSIGVVGAVYHIPAGSHPDFAALDVLETLLTSEPSGPLYKALVVSKKATDVSASAYGFHDPGVLEILVKADKNATLDSVRDILLETMNKVQAGPIPAEEVDRAKAKVAKQYEMMMTDSNRIGVQLSEWAARGEWRLFFLHRDRVAKVTPADVERVAKLYLQRNNLTLGMFYPTDKPQRADIPQVANVSEMLKDYKGGKAVVAGEFFDYSPANIEKRVQRSTLSSGVKVALLPKKTRGETVTLQLTLHYGNGESLLGKTSASQFVASLMAKGTKKHTRQQLEDELDKLKAKLSGSGLIGDAKFSIVAKRDTLPRVLALLAEILREPTFPAQEFDVLKRQLRDGLEEGRTDPTALASRAMQQKLNPFPKDNIRYVPSVDESIARLEAVTVDQVKAIYDEQLNGQNGELVAVGDFEPAEVLKQLEDALKDWKSEVAYKRIARPAVTTVKGQTDTILTPDKANAFWMAGMMLAMKDTDPDNAALEVGDFLFGGGSLSSRLGNRVRQKEGLSYGVRSQFSADPQDSSARFIMYAITNPTNIDKVDKAMLDEMDKMRKDGVDSKELEESQKAYLAQAKVRRSSDSALANMLQEGLQVGRTFEYYADLEKKVTELTPEAVTSAFRRYLDPKKLVIIKAGDFKAGK